MVDTEKVKTKAEEKATGARPYVTMLNPRQVIGWKSKMVDGKVVLTELRIKEVVIEDGDDFGQTKVEQIRYLTPEWCKSTASRKVSMGRRTGRSSTNGQHLVRT